MASPDQEDGDNNNPHDAAALRARLLGSDGKIATSALGRLWRTGRSAIGLGAAMMKNRRGEEVDLGAVAATVERLGALKGVAMKLGQMLGYVDHSVPAEMRAMLSLLQTAAPTTPWDAVARTIEDRLGARAAQLLDGMERAPIAAASIGQVHRGRLPDGTEVAIKVRHPGIEDALRADFRSASLGRVVGAMMGASTVSEFIDEARTAFLEECDFALEAERQRRFAEIFDEDPVISVPAVLREWSSDAVLVTRFSPGRSFDEFLAANPSQAARDEAGAALYRFWVRTLYRDGLFHGDPHPGNFAFREDGRIVVYDYGCVRAFEPELRRNFSRLAGATRSDDVAAMAEALEALGGRAPKKPEAREHMRKLLRGFFAPLLEEGARRIAEDEGFAARDVMKDKRAVMGLALPGRMLFLFRLRFGLYAVLSRLGAEVDWARMEGEWAGSF